MWSLKDGDVVVAVDKESLTSPTFTVKIEGDRDLFLLSRRYSSIDRLSCLGPINIHDNFNKKIMISILVSSWWEGVRE